MVAQAEQSTESSPAAQDFGSRQTRTRKIFEASFLAQLKRADYLPPEHLYVAGDPSTEVGRALAGTFLDDGRATLPWSDEHEQILYGLLTGSSLRRVKSDQLGPGGEQVYAEQVGPDGGKSTVAAKSSFECAVSDGQPCLVYLEGAEPPWDQGHAYEVAGQWSYNWCAVVDDGRQRLRAARELQRRLDWVARVVNAHEAAFRAANLNPAKPESYRRPGLAARRNALIKLGMNAAAPVDRRLQWIDACAQLVLQLSGEAAKSGHPWRDTTVSDGCGELRYSSPEVGDSLAWLDAVTAQAITGKDDGLGATDGLAKSGWLKTVREGETDTAEARERARAAGLDPDAVTEGVRAYDVWLKISVVGVNVDPNDAGKMLAAVAAKEAQVPSPPSVFARQVERFMAATRDPSNPQGEALFDRAALAKKLGKSPETIGRYQILLGMCAEVQALVDGGQMSMTFALGERESPFITWPKKGPATPIPFDKQRLVLSHLLAAAEDGDGPHRFVGERAMRAATKLRDAALRGELRPVGSAQLSDSDDGGAEVVRGSGTARTTPSDGAGESPPQQRGESQPGAPTAQQGGRRGRPRGPQLDVAQLREHAARAMAEYEGIRMPQPEDFTSPEKYGEAGRVVTYDELAITRALCLYLCGAEPIASLAEWPHVQQLLAAATQPVTTDPARQEVQESDLLADWVSSAVEDYVLSGAEVPTVSAETAGSTGLRPTAAQVDACNARIAHLTEQYALDGGDCKTLDEFILLQVNQPAN